MPATVVAASEHPSPAPAPASVPMPPDVMVEKYILLRDKVKEIKDRHTLELAKFNLAMNALEGYLLQVLNDNNAQNMTVPAGTFFKKTTSSVKVNGWSQTLDFIRETGRWELLEARVNKTMAEALIVETQKDIPGVVVTRETEVQVRRA